MFSFDFDGFKQISTCFCMNYNLTTLMPFARDPKALLLYHTIGIYQSPRNSPDWHWGWWQTRIQNVLWMAEE